MIKGISMIPVLHISPTSGLWGAERSILQILSNLPADKYTPVLYIPGHGALINEAAKRGIETAVFKLHSPKNPAGVFKTIKKIRGVIRKKNIKIIHSHHPRGNIYACLASAGLKIPAVWHFRNLPEKGMIDYENMLLRYADAGIAISNAVARRFYNRKKIRVIYNPVGDDFFERHAGEDVFRKEHKIPDNRVLIGFLSRIEKRKRLGILFELIPELIKKHNNVNFVVVKDSDKKLVDALKRTSIDKGFENKIIWIPFQEDIIPVLDSIDILFHPARYEAFGRIIVEAGARRVPSLVYAHGGQKEIINDGVNGMLFRNNRNDLLNKMLTLIESKKIREEMGKTAHRMFRERFSIKPYIRELDKLYESLF